LLLFEQGGVEPGSRIIWIQAFGQIEFPVGAREIAFVAISFAQVTAEHRALRFERGGGEEVLAAFETIPLSNPAEAASKPGVAQARIDVDRVSERIDGFTD